MAVVVTASDGKFYRYPEAVKYFASPEGYLSVVSGREVLALFKDWTHAELEGGRG